ncbi:hypothetical protein [Streptomyces iconiensis]|uniref:Hpr(Ser) kinase/phosphatase n=1 Tax=Streptomyces iconiensis TaxID=1384038 RepID=A0ABT6ZPN4_9ACTN|nr:hypothetical protein [Streptomyces iconiensis]MDJ1130764.1 hypothetical protein [Streptomyces iconiensis]
MTGPVTRYVCRTPEHAVELDASPAVAGHVRASLAPFVQVVPAFQAPPARWRVGVARRGLPRGEETVITNSTEPPTRLWCDGTARELLFDPAMPHDFLLHNLVRFVRILLRLLHTEDPEVFLHAGLVAREARGALVLGPKRSGKTSTVLAALRAGHRFVGNDDVTLRTAGEGWKGRGWPRRVSVRGDTFAAVGLPGDADRLLRPAELRELTGSPPVLAQSPVSALVFPRFSAGAGGLIPLDPGDVLARLEANQLPAAVKHADFLLPHFSSVLPCVRRELLALAASDVPGFELRQDFSALGEGALALTRLLSGHAPCERHRP